MRRIAWLLAVTLCVLAVAGSALADKVDLDGVRYNVEEGYTTIEKYLEDTETITVHGMVHGSKVWMESLEDWTYPKNARTLVIAAGTTEVPMLSLYAWENLQRIALPESVENIPIHTIMPVPTLQAYQVHPRNPTYQSVDGVLLSRDGKTLVAFPEAKGTHYDVPVGVEQIEWGAFTGNKTLTSLTLPEGFVYMDERITDMSYALERIEIPSTVRSISREAFPVTKAMKEVVIAADNPWYEVREGGVYSMADNMLIYYPPGRSTHVDVVPGTPAVAEGALRNHLVQSITLPRSITRLEDYMLYGCTALQSVSLPITLASIGHGALMECVSLTRITIPPAVETIEARAFTGCGALREVYLPDGIRYIDPTAFQYTHPDMVIYAAEGSAGHAYAQAHGHWWAPPGGTPQKLEATRGEIAVVNLDKATDTLALRAEPSDRADILRTYPNGATVEIVAEAGAWTQVRMGPHQGYLPAASLRKMDAATHVVSLDMAIGLQSGDNGWLQLYTYPGMDAPVVEPYDTYLMEVLDVVGPWYYVRTNEVCAYLPANNAQVSREDTGDGRRYGVVVNPQLTDRLNLREKASTKSAALDKLFTGVQVEILSEEGEWFRVSAGGKTGYVLQQFVSEVVNGDLRDVWW